VGVRRGDARARRRGARARHAGRVGERVVLQRDLGRAIHPTPTDRRGRRARRLAPPRVAHFRAPDLAIALLGENRAELGGSEWLALRRGLERGVPPEVDLEHEKRLADLLVAAIARARSRARTTSPTAGSPWRSRVLLHRAGTRRRARRALDSLRPDALVFGESTGRVIATTADAQQLLALAARHGVPAAQIGTTGGERLAIGPAGARPWIDEPVDALHAIWSSAIPRRLREG
jgi:phosphoribosylformylglycinamidine synthase